MVTNLYQRSLLFGKEFELCHTQNDFTMINKLLNQTTTFKTKTYIIK